jgi:hypothetical protein
LAEQRAHDNVRSPRLVHHRRSECIVLIAKDFQSFRQGPAPQVGAAAHDQTCGFAPRMRVNDSDPFLNPRRQPLLLSFYMEAIGS